MNNQDLQLQQNLKDLEMAEDKDWQLPRWRNALNSLPQSHGGISSVML